MVKTCEFCNVEFKTYEKKRRFCSNKCSQASRKVEPEKRKCIACGDVFFVKWKKSKRKFCSSKCSVNYPCLKAEASRSLSSPDH